MMFLATVLLRQPAWDMNKMPQPDAHPSSSTTGSHDCLPAVDRARRHIQIGAPASAKRILEKTVRSHPRDAEAWYLLASAVNQLGDQKRATDFLRRAVALCPSNADYLASLGEMYRQQHKFQDAIAALRESIELQPASSDTHVSLAKAHLDAGDIPHAEESAHVALALEPEGANTLCCLGAIMCARHDLPGAIEYFGKALVHSPDSWEILLNLGRSLIRTGHPGDAIPLLERATFLAPRNAECQSVLGLGYTGIGKREDAEQTYRKALELNKDEPDALIGLAGLVLEKGNLVEAAKITRQAVKIAPKRSDAWTIRGHLLRSTGKPQEAEMAFRNAETLDPESGPAAYGLAMLDLEAGRMDAAESRLKDITISTANALAPLLQLVHATKIRAGDGRLAALERFAEHSENFRDADRIALHYALGKAYDDIGDYDRAFAHFLEGGREKRSKLEFDPNHEAELFDAITQDYTSLLFDRLKGAGVKSDVPIFILGMPRSGTTLTEQIIASHPDVHGAGEMSLLQEIVRIRQPMGRFIHYPANLQFLTPEILRTWGSEYIGRLKPLAPKARRITDKMPYNYFMLGLIPLMMPNARIIHVRRDPVDTCLSCFMQNFALGQYATYDLAELGIHYRNYARLMNHWRTVLPPNSFLELQYEHLTADTETQTRRIIEYCGLKWDDACLDFRNNGRPVRTASISQVRQPIYRSSVERWRHYARHLAPLLDALMEFAPANSTSCANR